MHQALKVHKSVSTRATSVRTLTSPALTIIAQTYDYQIPAMSSFADAIAVYKLAWGLAQAFTKGRKSAPAEFREVENQLYSLSAALGAFRGALGKGTTAQILDNGSGSDDGEISVRKVLSNCEETLQHLETLLKKYDIISEHDAQDGSASAAPPQRLGKRLSASFAKDYKIVTWPTQKDDLATLRGQLMVHTNSLDLVMGVIVNSQARSIEETLKEHSAILKQIQTWGAAVAHNANTQLVSGATSAATVSSPVHQHLTFEVYLENDDGSRRLVCGLAALHDGWDATLTQDNHDNATPLFACLHHLTDGSDHASELSNFAFSHVSFPFRLLEPKRT